MSEYLEKVNQYRCYETHLYGCEMMDRTPISEGRFCDECLRRVDTTMTVTFLLKIFHGDSFDVAILKSGLYHYEATSLLDKYNTISKKIKVLRKINKWQSRRRLHNAKYV